MTAVTHCFSVHFPTPTCLISLHPASNYISSLRSVVYDLVFPVNTENHTFNPVYTGFLPLQVTICYRQWTASWVWNKNVHWTADEWLRQKDLWKQTCLGGQQSEQRRVSIWPHTTALKWLTWKWLLWEQLKYSLSVEKWKVCITSVRLSSCHCVLRFPFSQLTFLEPFHNRLFCLELRPWKGRSTWIEPLEWY